MAVSSTPYHRSPSYKSLCIRYCTLFANCYRLRTIYHSPSLILLKQKIFPQQMAAPDHLSQMVRLFAPHSPSVEAVMVTILSKPPAKCPTVAPFQVAPARAFCSNLQNSGTYQPEADVVSPVVRIVAVPIRRTQVPTVVVPAPAALHPVRPGNRPSRIRLRTGRITFVPVVPVPTPFIHIPVHVIKSVIVRRITSYRCRLAYIPCCVRIPISPSASKIIRKRR